MATIKKDKYYNIKKSYNSGMSAKEIAEDFKVSIDAVYYFLRKYKIPRRTGKDVSKLCFERKKPSFILKKNLTDYEKQLKIAGVSLYWGEGSKWEGEKIVDFANSNPQMIEIFLKFLIKICGINKKKLRVLLYCHSNQDAENLKKYWSKLTGISKKQFTKPYIKKSNKKNKEGKMKYGLIHVRYNDKKLLILIKKWINEFANKFN
ncbi:MAG: hypothetical protein ABH881_04520 [bacterium]